MTTDTHPIADDQVRSAFQRWKNLEEEKARISEDLKELFAEQKAFGHDTKAMRAAFRLKVKMDEASPEDAEHEALVDTYLAALEAPRASRAYARENIVKSGTINGGVRTDGPAIDFGTVRIMEEQREAALRSDGGLSILTKHYDITTAPVTAEEACRASEEAAPVTGRPAEPVNSLPTEGCGYAHTEGNATQSGVTAGETATNLPETATRPGQDVQSPSQRALAGENLDVTAGETATISPEEAEEEFPSAEREDRAAANAGGDHVTSIAKREVEFDRNQHTGEGAANTALPADSVKLEYVPPFPMKRLPYAHCFPELSKAEYERLEKDIAANRVRDPIIRQGDVIVDGWARYNISRAYGMSYPIQEIDAGRDVLLDVIEWQRAARNFTPAQEKKIAADLAKEIPHRADDIFSAFGLAEALEAAQ